jgi:tetratricopeptide (TPR) repeat protein
MYGFYYPEAVASFLEATRLDADCAMASWGVAQAYFAKPDDPQGTAANAIRRAIELAGRASQQDRGLIQALNVWYDSAALPDRGKRDLAHVNAMRELLKLYPDDPEIGTLFANSMTTLSAFYPFSHWAPDGSPYPGTLEAAAALEQVIQRVPNHPGANHYFIHLHEASQKPEIALPHAERLVHAMPGQGHIVHMPTHIYMLTGRYAEAVEANRASIAADEALVKAWEGYPIPPSMAMFHPNHARSFLLLAAEMQGNFASAMEAARGVAAAFPLTQLRAGPMQQFQGAFVRPWLTAKRFGKWQQLLDEPKPADCPPFVEGIWLFARGSALLATGRMQEAERTLYQLRSIQQIAGLDALMVRANSARRLLEIAGLVLEGELRASRGDNDRALLLLSEAVRLEDGLRYMEPPDWGHPVRHSLGAVLLAAGRAHEAEVVYWEDLRRNPENGWSLFGLWQSLLAQRDVLRASEVEKRFRRSWQGADVQLKASRF